MFERAPETSRKLQTASESFLKLQRVPKSSESSKERQRGSESFRELQKASFTGGSGAWAALGWMWRTWRHVIFEKPWCPNGNDIAKLLESNTKGSLGAEPLMWPKFES